MEYVTTYCCCPWVTTRIIISGQILGFTFYLGHAKEPKVVITSFSDFDHIEIKMFLQFTYLLLCF